MRILDAHVHLWDTSVFPLPWLANVPVLSGHYDFDAVSSPLADGVICVQAGETLVEAEWLIEQAAQFAGIEAVVLQYSPSEHDGHWAGAVQAAVDQSLANGGPVAGLRIPARAAADNLDAVPGIDALCAGLAARGLVLELLLRPSQLPSVARLAERFPELRMVICHLGIGQDPLDAGWHAGMEELAGHANVHAKISGILPLAGDARHPEAPGVIVRAALDSLGADRLLFGSDWPMSIRTGMDYGGVLESIAAEIAGCTAAERGLIFGGTARTVYRLSR